MSFFNSELNEYLASIEHSLKGDKLISISDYVPYLEETNVVHSIRDFGKRGSIKHKSPSSGHSPARTIRHTAKQVQYDQADIISQKSLFVQELSDSICQDIVGSYGQRSVSDSLGGGDFDLLLRVSKNYKTNINPALGFHGTALSIALEKVAQIKAFIVVQQGECKKYPNTYTVKLICGRGKGDAMPLLGAYCYTVTKNNAAFGNNDLGILELAEMYSNIPGLCSYTKFGFKEDLNLVGINCYPFFMYCVPMSSDFSARTPEQVIDVVKTNVGFDTHPICLARGSSQKLLMNLYTILYFLRCVKKMNAAYKLSNNGDDFVIKNHDTNQIEYETSDSETRILIKIISTYFDAHLPVAELINCVNNNNANLDEMFDNICGMIQFQIDYVKQNKSFSLKMGTPLSLKRSSSSGSIDVELDEHYNLLLQQKMKSKGRRTSVKTSNVNATSGVKTKKKVSSPRKSFTRRAINSISSRFSKAAPFTLAAPFKRLIWRR